MTYRIVTRTEVGLPAVVKGSSGALRPPMFNERYITAHYTGNNVDYTDKATADVVRQIQRVFYASKPFEYNYVIGQADDDEIVEFAGKFQAAHSAGENADAVGVLFLLGVGEPLTDRMVDKWRWLRDVLIFDGVLKPGVDQRMHFQMPDAATQCPGPVRDRWAEMLLPWSAPVTAPIITPDLSEEDEVTPYILKPPTGTRDAESFWLVVQGGSVRYASSHDLNEGWEVKSFDNVWPGSERQQYLNMLKSAGLKAA